MCLQQYNELENKKECTHKPVSADKPSELKCGNSWYSCAHFPSKLGCFVVVVIVFFSGALATCSTTLLSYFSSDHWRSSGLVIASKCGKQIWDVAGRRSLKIFSPFIYNISVYSEMASAKFKALIFSFLSRKGNFCGSLVDWDNFRDDAHLVQYSTMTLNILQTFILYLKDCISKLVRYKAGICIPRTNG